MVYYTDIRKTQHHIEYHKKQVPLFEIIKVIKNNSKNIKKKNNKFEIETKNYYILLETEESILYIINAKRK